MKRYPAYKDSGIEWLGKIPIEWSVKRLKYLGDAIIGLIYSPSEICDEPIGTLVLRASNIKDGSLVFEDNVYVNKEIPDQLITQEGDILVCSRSGSRRLIGKNALITKTVAGCTFGAFMTIIRSEYHHYLFYVFNSTLFEYQAGSFLTSTINQLTQGNLNSFEIPFPKLNDQPAITSYLNHKTHLIDTLIEKKQKQIELLKEQRAAIINQAVTKGLDPKVKMKDSGIEWLGEIPEHWMVLPIKQVVETPVTDGPHETPDFLDDGIPFISAEAIKNDRIDFSKKRGFISQEDHEKYSKKYKPRKGDIYMVKSGATAGNVAVVETDMEFNIWSPLAVIRPHSKKAITRHVFFFMKSKSFFQAVELSWSYGTQQNIGMGVIENIPIVLPPIPEQKVISSFLDRKISKIDHTTSEMEKEIDLLQEYRTTLISEVVTGKIDVRDEVIS